jgi:hypothetical protein
VKKQLRRRVLEVVISTTLTAGAVTAFSVALWHSL